MSNQHEKSEPELEEETNPLIQALRGAKGERRQEIQRLKKQLEQDLQKKIMEYIEVLGISKSVADAARLGKTSVKIDIRGAQNHFQRYYNTTDVFNFVENKSMELRFEKKWTEFFHQFKKTIAVDDLKESTLVQEAILYDDVQKTIETNWPLSGKSPKGLSRVTVKIDTTDGEVWAPHGYDNGELHRCTHCKFGPSYIWHKPEYKYPDWLMVKWD